MPAVSYVVTIYNKRPLLPFLLAGLGSQEGEFEREFIFVDDGSTDDSAGLLKELTSGWRNVTIVSQANAGPAPALNVGFRHASGDFIKPMDGDDLLLPWGTRRLLEAIETSGCAVAFAPLDKPYDASAPPEEVLAAAGRESGRIERLDDMLRRSLQRAQTNPSAWLARAEAVRASGGCDERVFIQDYSIELRLAARDCFTLLHERIAMGPSAAADRLNDNQAQILHDMNAALANFITERPDLPRDLRRLAFCRAAARAWAWARRHGGKGFRSREFALLCGARLGLLQTTPENLHATCTAFAETNSIRIPVAGPKRDS